MSEDYYKNLPKKRIGSGVLFFNKHQELLIVKPVYKDHWSIPGGVVDENESPRSTCIREVKEEIGLDIENLQFLGVDWLSLVPEVGDMLQFIFFGGVLSLEQIKEIKLDPKEISEYQFLPIEKALTLLSKKMKVRISKCFAAIKNKTTVYLEDGE